MSQFFQGLVESHLIAEGQQIPKTRKITFKQTGRPVGYRATETQKRRTTVHLDQDVAQALQNYCKDNDEVMSHVISRVLRRAFLEDL